MNRFLSYFLPLFIGFVLGLNTWNGIHQVSGGAKILKERTQLKAECEKSLPRDQECKMTFVVAGSNNKVVIVQ